MIRDDTKTVIASSIKHIYQIRRMAVLGEGSTEDELDAFIANEARTQLSRTNTMSDSQIVQDMLMEMLTHMAKEKPSTAE